MEIKPIGKIINDYDTKFAVPRQSGLVNEFKSRIVFFEPYSNEAAFKEIDGFSHLWIIWEFDKNSHRAKSLTVRPPRLGGNKKVGVFASRSPYRPNPIGLSSVKLEAIEKDENGKISLIISGADIVSGTPIYDIKPYISFSDCHLDARCGYADENKDYSLNVEINDEFLSKIPFDKQNALKTILSGDPRPAYQEDNRQYGFSFSGKEIKFIVNDKTLIVTDICDER